ncbi:nuclear transport factor 2 family protein [Streptomyces sp. NPDC057242]|uniref:nuclear transport factor 2 family protein n=1 Tax=unclassified Streptomyces TaxID=2593676 RepID=UPI003635752B
MTVEPVRTEGDPLGNGGFPALYADVQRFYASQMELLDTHDTGRWTETFTEDAVIELPSPAPPLPARSGLGRYVRAGAARRRARGRLDHWVGMLDVRPREDGTLRTRCSALVHAAPHGGGPPVLYVYAMEDVLVRAPGTWRVAHRRVTRDDLA